MPVIRMMRQGEGLIDEGSFPSQSLGKLVWEAGVSRFQFCGSNSVREALLAGAPLICFPGGAAQPANASRLARAGVGVLLAKKNQVGPAIRQLLVNCAAVEERPKALASELKNLDATEQGADVIEMSARTGHVALPGKGRWPVWPLFVFSALLPIFAFEWVLLCAKQHLVCSCQSWSSSSSSSPVK